ncbi:MAG TPA: HypC/HybG/HupF family hydrogenase formation chaperone, partial [Ginsengibacter sp.]|nr:HypC/HybG/HupF family hydrogenase formation chaperone [Ginsengibacter sp.]
YIKKSKTIMCLAIPGKVISVESEDQEIFRTGKISFGGIIKQVNLSMVPGINVGEYVLVHVGVAVGKIDEQEAMLTLEYLEQMGEMDDLSSITDKIKNQQIY